MYGSMYYPQKGYKPYGHHSYSQISGPNGYLHKLQTFKGHSMSGGWQHLQGFSEPVCVVKSLDTVIAAYDPATDTKVIDHSDYSHTTTHHQEIAAAWLPGKDLEDLIDKAVDAIYGERLIT